MFKKVILAACIALSGCVSTPTDEEFCQKQSDYWKCMQYMQAERHYEMLLLQNAVDRTSNAFKPSYVIQPPLRVCTNLNCYGQ